MTPDAYDDILDDLFLGCAFAACLDLAAENRSPPDREAARLLAYRYYEEALAGKSLKQGLPSARRCG
jgi:hypothetical protein